MSDQHEEQPVSWNPPVPGSSWEPDPSVVPILPTAPLTTPAAAPEGKPKRRGVAIAGAVALVAAGGFAVTQLAGGSEGGAATPEAAVEALVQAMNEEDVLGVMDVLLPGERRTFRQPMTDMVSEFRRLELLDEQADLGRIGGADLEIIVDDMDVDEVADDIARVTLSGDASISVDSEQLPLGDLLIDEMLNGERPTDRIDDETEFGRRTDNEFVVTTVRDDGRWYVSLFYTVAEAARGDLDVPDPEDAVVPAGGSSPEATIDLLLGAVTDLDLEAVIEVLSPDEFAALQRYAPLFLDDLQAQLDEVSGVSVEFVETAYDVESKGGDRAAVGFQSFLVEASLDGQDVELEWDGECMVLVVPESAEEVTGCVGDPVDFTSDTAEPERVALAAAAEAFAGTHPLLTVKVDGEWYVSVLGSVLDSMVEALRAVEADELRDGIEQVTDILSGGVLPDVFGTGGLDPTVEDVFADDVFSDDTVPESGQEEVGPDLTLPDGDQAQSAADTKLDECYSIIDPDEAFTCFQLAIDDGILTDADLPTAMRYAECGLGPGWWNYRIYEQLTDAEFTELVSSAHACFLTYVEAGEIGREEVPYEAHTPECWSGINPYLLSDDDFVVASEQYDSCAYS